LQQNQQQQAKIDAKLASGAYLASPTAKRVPD
jgi:hypothetical protein